MSLFESASDAEAQAQAAAAAAPLVAERADLALLPTLDTALREPMFRLLSSLADNKYLLGRRYAEWCTGAPLLESAVAAAAMAQDELGHARSFYPLLRSFRDVPAMEEKGWQNRPTSAMRSLDQHFEAWTDFVAVNVVIDSAMTTLLDAATDSPYEPLRQRARKIVHEEAAHWVHGSGWLRRLGPATGNDQAFTRVWDDAMTWFGQADDATIEPLATGGLISAPPDELRARLRAQLTPVLERVGLGELTDRSLPWERWDPATRRLEH